MKKSLPPNISADTAGRRQGETQHQGQGPHPTLGPHPSQGPQDASAGALAEMVSAFLFRQRRAILATFAVLVVAVVAWGVYSALASAHRQKAALAVYELRRSFDEWKEAHPQDVLAAQKSLAGQGREDALELDAESAAKAAETEAALVALLDESSADSRKNVQAWGYWIRAQKAHYLENRDDLQQALEYLIALDEAPFRQLARLHLAGLHYAAGKVDEAAALWRELADVSGPQPEQLIASIYLANYLARTGRKEDAIRYWQQVQSLGDELLQANGIEDSGPLAAGENPIVSTFRNSLSQWKAMAENQLLFLQSETIEIAADSYDESVAPAVLPAAGPEGLPGIPGFGTTGLNGLGPAAGLGNLGK